MDSQKIMSNQIIDLSSLSITKYDYEAFALLGMKSVILISTSATINFGLFDGCSLLESAQIHFSFTAVPDRTFRDFASLSYLKIYNFVILNQSEFNS
jgi:hypothetical protein